MGFSESWTFFKFLRFCKRPEGTSWNPLETIARVSIVGSRDSCRRRLDFKINFLLSFWKIRIKASESELASGWDFENSEKSRVKNPEILGIGIEIWKARKNPGKIPSAKSRSYQNPRDRDRHLKISKNPVKIPKNLTYPRIRDFSRDLGFLPWFGIFTVGIGIFFVG